jgi:nucleoid-associated protein YgaU
MMTATSIGRIAVPSLAVVAACGAAIAFGIVQLRREPPPELSVATTTASPATAAQDKRSAALATAQDAKAMVAELAVPPPAPAVDESLPAFDVARIERTGDAVIAGRAAPGAMVELLRNGEHQDQTVADASGQFVMVPPRLPAGSYELTLRSRLPDGTLETSKHAVAVALDAVQPTSTLQSQAEAPAHVPETAAANQPRQKLALASPPQATAATVQPDAAASTTSIEPRNATRVVSRGDSLWSISRRSLGNGTRYAVVYRANRDRIRDPNLIYPGQILVLPAKTR